MKELGAYVRKDNRMAHRQFDEKLLDTNAGGSNQESLSVALFILRTTIHSNILFEIE